MTVVHNGGALAPVKSDDDIADFVSDRGTAYRGDRVERRSIEELLEFISPKHGEVVLDAGCGTALNAVLLGGRVERVIGIDSDSTAVARARIRLSRAGVLNVFVMKGDIAAVPLANQSVDRIICLSVMQYFDDDGVRNVLCEFKRLLRPGGELILHVKNRASLYGVSLLFAKRLIGMFRDRGPTIYHMRRYDYYVRELAAAGFQLRDHNSFNLFLVERMPRWLFTMCNTLEFAQRRRFPFSSRFVRRHGLDLKLRATSVEQVT